MVKEIILFVILIIALITDIQRDKIYNWLTLPAILVGLTWSTIAASSWGSGLLDAVLGLALGIGFFFPLWQMGKFGGGDAKLFGVIGAFTGLQFTFWAIAFTLAAGAAVSLAKLCLQRRLVSTVTYLITGIVTRSLDTGKLSTVSAGRKYPYTVAILAGTVLAYGCRQYEWLELPF